MGIKIKYLFLLLFKRIIPIIICLVLPLISYVFGDFNTACVFLGCIICFMLMRIGDYLSKLLILMIINSRIKF